MVTVSFCSEKGNRDNKGKQFGYDDGKPYTIQMPKARQQQDRDYLEEKCP